VSRILVVDDEVSLTPLFAKALERVGYDVAVAHSLWEAQQVPGPFDAIVADIRLPNGDGRDLRSLYPGIPFVVISGFDADSVAAMTEPYFLPKPFNPPSLQAMVKKALEEHP